MSGQNFKVTDTRALALFLLHCSKGQEFLGFPPGGINTLNILQLSLAPGG